jgi:hypothetical protein
MFLASEELAPLTMTNRGVSVRYGSEPVEPMHVCFAHKRACACVTTANLQMNVM